MARQRAGSEETSQRSEEPAERGGEQLNVASEWPLVGRADELAFVADLFDAADGPYGVVLAGEPGVGKTRLAREALARRRRVARWAVASESNRAMPLGPFAALLGRWPGADPGRLMEHALAELTPTDGSALLLGVDDGHLLDDLSATLLHQLVTRARVRVVLTVRTGVSAPAAITSLWKDGYLARLEVARLSRSSTAALLEAALGGPVEATTSARLWDTTQGNPLYLRLLVAGERDAARLTDATGVWRWTGRPELTASLLGLVEARMGQLERSMTEVLDVLALAGPIPVSALTRLVDPELVEVAESRGLVEVTPADSGYNVRLGHPLFGEVRRARCEPARARRLRGRVAALLGEVGAGQPSGGAARDAELFRRAVLTLESDLPPDVGLYTEGAMRAVHVHEMSLAARLAQAAVRAGGGFEPQLILGYALCMAGEGAQAEVVLAEAAKLASADAERAAVVMPRGANLFWTLARPRDAELMLEAAMRAVRAPAAMAGLTALRAVFDAYLGRTRTVLDRADAVLASPHATGQARSMAGWAQTLARGGLGQLDGLFELVGRIDAIDDSFASGRIRAGGMGMSWLRALRLAGLLADAEHWLRGYAELFAGQAGLPSVILGVMTGHQALAKGQVRSAERAFRDAAGNLDGADPGGWTLQVLLGLTLSLAMAGEITEARRALTKLLPARHPGFVFLEPAVVLARAWVAAAEGVGGEARALALQAAERAASQDQPAVEARARHTAVRFGDPGQGERLAELATGLDGPFAAAAAAHASAFAAGDGAMLLAAARRFEEMGARLLASDAAAQAAEAYRRAGEAGAAQLASAHTQRLAQSCEGARTPALVALAAPLPLTAREREIVALAAEGLTNRQIADRLTVSIRTVEGHLYRASIKLGISDRGQFTELVDRAAERPPEPTRAAGPPRPRSEDEHPAPLLGRQ